MTERFNSSPKHERYDQAQQAPGSPAHGKFGTKHIGHLGDGELSLCMTQTDLCLVCVCMCAASTVDCMQRC